MTTKHPNCRMEEGGLTAAMVAWLLDHRDELEAQPSGQLAMNWSAGTGNLMVDYPRRERVSFAATRKTST